MPYRLAIAHHFDNTRLCSKHIPMYILHITDVKQLLFYNGWIEGLEPSASRATIWRASRLRHTHHIEYVLTYP